MSSATRYAYNMALRQRPLSLLVVVLSALAACERRHEPNPRLQVQNALRGVAIYPLSTSIGMAAGEDAAQMTLTTADSVNRVADWFRRSLIAAGWALQSDLTNPDGSIAISATHGTRPLRLTLRPNAGAHGTTYTVIAPLKDSGSASESEAEREREGRH